MAFAAELTCEGKPLPKMLFIDIMMEKPQMLINHLKHLHLGLSLVGNINENVATLKMYDNYAVNSLLLHVTILNLRDIKDCEVQLKYDSSYMFLCNNPCLQHPWW